VTSLNQIWQFDLRSGNSPDPREGACLLDAVSWFEYGTLGDHPACVCPVIAAFARPINDALSNADRQRLKVYIPRLVGTVDPTSEQARVEYLAWQAVRVFVPLALDGVGAYDDARSLRNFSGTLREAEAAANAIARAYARAAALAHAAHGHAAYAAHAAAAHAARAAAAAPAARAARAAAAAHAASIVMSATGVRAVITVAVIATLDGVLRIGRQARPIEAVTITEANDTFRRAAALV